MASHGVAVKCLYCRFVCEVPWWSEGHFLLGFSIFEQIEAIGRIYATWGMLEEYGVVNIKFARAGNSWPQDKPIQCERYFLTHQLYKNCNIEPLVIGTGAATAGKLWGNNHFKLDPLLYISYI